jgi:membrane protein implicated in regulation of membrane protease activity
MKPLYEAALFTLFFPLAVGFVVTAVSLPDYGRLFLVLAWLCLAVAAVPGVTGLAPWIATLVLIVFAAVMAAALAVGWRMFEPVTPRNAERMIRSWIGAKRLQVESITTDRNALFNLVVTLPNRSSVNIIKHKEIPQYVRFGTSISLSLTGPIPRAQLDLMAARLRLEYVKMGFQYTNIRPPFQNMIITKEVPITSALTEDKFLENLLLIGTAAIVATSVCTEFVLPITGKACDF